MFKSAVMVALFFSIGTPMVVAQTGFFKAWEDRVRATSARQPSWPVPVVSPASVIVQLARTDFVHQYTSTHAETWTYGNGKGVNFIPFARTEFDINLPAYIQHNTPKVKDGESDFSFVAKYRMFARNEGGNYSSAVQMAFSVPTGSYKNGTAVSTLTPTVIGGKGFGKFAVQSAIGAYCRRVRCLRSGVRFFGTVWRSTRSGSISGPSLRPTPAIIAEDRTTEEARCS